VAVDEDDDALGPRQRLPERRDGVRRRARDDGDGRSRAAEERLEPGALPAPLARPLEEVQEPGPGPPVDAGPRRGVAERRGVARAREPRRGVVPRDLHGDEPRGAAEAAAVQKDAPRRDEALRAARGRGRSVERRGLGRRVVARGGRAAGRRRRVPGRGEGEREGAAAAQERRRRGARGRVPGRGAAVLREPARERVREQGRARRPDDDVDARGDEGPGDAAGAGGVHRRPGRGAERAFGRGDDERRRSPARDGRGPGRREARVLRVGDAGDDDARGLARRGAARRARDELRRARRERRRAGALEAAGAGLGGQRVGERLAEDAREHRAEAGAVAVLAARAHPAVARRHDVAGEPLQVHGLVDDRDRRRAVELELDAGAHGEGHAGEDAHGSLGGFHGAAHRRCPQVCAFRCTFMYP